MALIDKMTRALPPYAHNLLLIQGMTREPLGRITRAAFPFFLIMMGFALILALFPQLALYLPSQVDLRG